MEGQERNRIENWLSEETDIANRLYAKLGRTGQLSKGDGQKLQEALSDARYHSNALGRGTPKFVWVMTQLT
jgi:hypothetical protein